MKLGATSGAHSIPRTIIGRVARAHVSPDARADTLLYATGAHDNRETDGYLALLLEPGVTASTTTELPFVELPPTLSYLDDGDVVRIQPDGFIRVLYRKASAHNFIFATDRCNSYCKMCSQPPRDVDETGIIDEHRRLVDLMDPATEHLGITGGEPTLLKDDFLRLVEHCKRRLPGASLHVLSNGRLFYYRSFAERLGAIGHTGLTMAVPLYSDIDREHDAVVEAVGAFDQTVIGLGHLAEFQVPVEIRVVLHKMTVGRLEALATFIARNLPFVEHVALMGLELTGLVHQNLPKLWIDPFDYQAELVRAVQVLRFAGLNVSIYNHQLCVLDRRLWPIARQSISDWKNVYVRECEGCSVREQCGGFFESGIRRTSTHIRAVDPSVEAETLSCDRESGI